MQDPIPFGRSLDGVMRSLRGTDRRQIGGVFGRWEEAVGAQVAAHVRPVKLDGDVLVVEADSSAWATQVRFLGDSIRARLDEVAGVRIERVEVRVTGRRRPRDGTVREGRD